MLLQVDQNTETLSIQIRELADTEIAGRLARKGLRPKHMTLAGSLPYAHSSSSAMATFLATEQQRPMFQHLQRLTIEESLPRNLPQVSTEPPGGIDPVCHWDYIHTHTRTHRKHLVQHARNAAGCVWF
jgi:hypothetical protein